MDEILLPKFAYEVRKQDENKYYTQKFLKPYIENALLYEIIENNVWDKPKKCMRTDLQFMLKVGKNRNFTLQYKGGDIKTYKWILIKKSVG